jgi:2-(1,2-epoxy-1,2-dihydrophenyl)acetyl-CoA isomerase
VLAEIRDHVATITLNRPARLNALTPESLRELRERLESLGDDREVRVVVLTGAGRAFSAGGDVDSLATGKMTSRFVRETAQLIEVLYSLRPVTIAAVNGACAGGGMALACAADLRFAARSAFFTTAFLRIGTTGDMGLPWALVRLVGLGKAKELSLLSDRIDAAEAEHIGLVNRTVPDDDLPAAVADVAGRLAGFAPLAAAGLKRNLNDAAVLDLPGFLDVESLRFSENSVSADSAEAVRAFVERRAPIYRGCDLPSGGARSASHAE